MELTRKNNSTNTVVSCLNCRMFDSLHALHVAERFSTEPPSKLIDFLIFWGTATAQAQCTAAYYALQENPRDAADIITRTLNELRAVPREFALLDRMLSLVETTQCELSVLKKLPPEMRKALRRSTTSDNSELIVPYFSPGNESSDWTFGGCYTRTIERMITKEMLSKKETAEQLSISLEKELADGPKQVDWTLVSCCDHMILLLIVRTCLNLMKLIVAL
jgi:hypothetical protein